MKTSLKYAIFKTKWGFFGLLADNIGLVRTVLPMGNLDNAKKYLLVGMFKSAKEEKGLYSAIQRDITSYYKGNYVNFNKSYFSVPLSGLSSFSRKVLQACKEIPFGKQITYWQLAKRAGFPKAARAVGSVLAKNPLPLIIPCHRVIRADGKIGNFSAPGGSRTKKKMLELERIQNSEHSRQKKI